MEVAVKYKYGSLVKVKNDIDKIPRMVTGYLLEKGSIKYQVTHVSHTTYHQSYEIEEYTPFDNQIN
jgi:hypothetical protein